MHETDVPFAPLSVKMIGLSGRQAVCCGELLGQGHQLAPGVRDEGALPGLRPGIEPRRPRHFCF